MKPKRTKLGTSLRRESKRRNPFQLVPEVSFVHEKDDETDLTVEIEVRG